MLAQKLSEKPTYIYHPSNWFIAKEVQVSLEKENRLVDGIP